MHRHKMHFSCLDILEFACTLSAWKDATLRRFSVLLFVYDTDVFGLVGLVVGDSSTGAAGRR